PAGAEREHGRSPALSLAKGEWQRGTQWKVRPERKLGSGDRSGTARRTRYRRPLALRFPARQVARFLASGVCGRRAIHFPAPFLYKGVANGLPQERTLP